MKRFHLLVTALIPISLLGCAAALKQQQLHTELTIAGVVGESSPGKYVLGDLTRTSLPRGPLHIREPLHIVPLLRLHRPLYTEEVVKARVFRDVGGNTYDYKLLLGRKLCLDSGPRFCPDHAARGWVVIRDQAPHKGAPTFHLHRGWAFLWTNPSIAVAKSEWVIGATCGSTMVVEVAQENQERVERVYCLEGEDVKVTCLIGSSSTFPLKPGEYVQIEKENNDCNFNGPYEITGSALERFITELKEIAETAGWK